MKSGFVLACGLAAGLLAMASSAHAEEFVFPHIMEVEGMISFPTHAETIRFQGDESLGAVDVHHSGHHGGGVMYEYTEMPSFNFAADSERSSVFSVMLHHGHGSTMQDDEKGDWILNMSFAVSLILNGESYLLPNEGTLDFSTRHSDPHAYPVGEDPIRHTDPLYLVFQSDLTFWKDGNPQSDTSITLFQGSRITVGPAVPAPASVVALGGALVIGGIRRRR